MFSGVTVPLIVGFDAEIIPLGMITFAIAQVFCGCLGGFPEIFPAFRRRFADAEKSRDRLSVKGA